jgi:hypothetical protein
VASTLEVTDTGQALAAADELRDAPARLEATLADVSLFVPLERAVAAAWIGPYAGVLAPATRVEPDPLAIVTAGSSPVLSGGASVDQLARGANTGGGGRVGQVRASRRNRAHTRHTTRQFRTASHVEDALEAAADQLLEPLADQLLEEIVGGAP